MKRKRIYLIAGLLFLLLFSGYFVFKSDDGGWEMPEALVGTWTGDQEVTVRSKSGEGDFVFTKSDGPVKIVLKIGENGVVEGSVGDAVFQGCSVKKNRGRLGKALNLATDCAITGQLKGKIFPGDVIPEKEISIPFVLEGNAMSGTLFEKPWMDIYPLAGVELRKGE